LVCRVRAAKTRRAALCDRSAAVTEIRAALAALGLLENSDEDLTTGRHVALELFDAELDQAVRAFQQHRGLLVDGSSVRPLPALKSVLPARARTLFHQFGAPLYGDDVATCRPGYKTSGSTPVWSTGTSTADPQRLDVVSARVRACARRDLRPDTLRSLYFLSSRVTGGSPHAIREEELVRGRARLSGKRSSSIRAAAVPTTG